jgi:cell shape-determining protein MreC
MKAFGWILGGFAVMVMLIVAANVLFVADTANRSAKGVITKTLDSDNVIQNYEWFKQTKQDYETAKANLTVAKKQVAELKQTPREKMDWSDKSALDKAQTTVTGQVAHVNQLAADYNARSKMTNRSIFKAGDVELPTSLELVNE